MPSPPESRRSGQLTSRSSAALSKVEKAVAQAEEIKVRLKYTILITYKSQDVGRQKAKVRVN